MNETKAIFEVTTALTDVILSLTCFFGACSLLKQRKGHTAVVFLLSIFLFFIGVSLTCGGIYHFLPPEYTSLKPLIWAITAGTSFIGFTILLCGTFVEFFNIKKIDWKYVLLVSACSLLGPFYSISINKFWPILAWEVFCIGTHTLVTASLSINQKNLRKRSLYIVIGTTFAVLSGIVQSSSIVFLWFDHNGIYHILQLPTVYFMWKAYYFEQSSKIKHK